VKCPVHPEVIMVEPPQTIEEDFDGNRKVIPAGDPFCMKCRMKAEEITEQDMAETRWPDPPVER